MTFLLLAIQLARQEIYFAGCHPMGFLALVRRWQVRRAPLGIAILTSDEDPRLQVMLNSSNMTHSFGGWYLKGCVWRLIWLQRHDGMWDLTNCLTKVRPRSRHPRKEKQALTVQATVLHHLLCFMKVFVGFPGDRGRPGPPNDYMQPSPGWFSHGVHEGGAFLPPVQIALARLFPTCVLGQERSIPDELEACFEGNDELAMRIWCTFLAKVLAVAPLTGNVHPSL